MADVTFFFDPACPWTWRASRWLTLVADSRGLAVGWRPMSLWILNDRQVDDEDKRRRLQASHRWLRVAAALEAGGRQADIARLYTATGDLVHEHGTRLDDALTEHVLRDCGLTDLGPALDDAALDGAVGSSTEAALAAAGPGVGSPVLLLAGAERGLHGPVLGSIPDKAQSLALWEAVEGVAPIADFFELKRGRR
ncbi:MAG TPA: DsbA family protein [Acidimicrobiia bacterium]|nr:DsbA family protein [Acidimicrobiia bacterium]